MDLVLRSGIEIHVLVDLGGLRRVEPLALIFYPVLIEALQEPSLEDGHNLYNRRQNGIDEHSLDDLSANESVPHVSIVIENAVESGRSWNR